MVRRQLERYSARGVLLTLLLIPHLPRVSLTLDGQIGSDDEIGYSRPVQMESLAMKRLGG